MTPVQDALVRAIVHLNFNEPDQALKVLLIALSDLNFEQGKDFAHGNFTAAA